MTLAPVRADLEGLVEIAVAADGTYPILHSSGALAARATIDGVWLVGASAHPIGGDRLAVAMDVGDQAFLSVHSASATLARGSDPPRPSRLDISAIVGPGGTLHWAPAPGIAANGSRHAADAVVGLHPTAALYWKDTVVLGRGGERGGSWSSRLRVEVAGRPLVVGELALGEAFAGWASDAVLAGARCVQSIVVVEPVRGAPGPRTHAASGVLLPLSECAVQLTTWGASVSECRAVRRALVDDAGLREWAGGVLDTDD